MTDMDSGLSGSAKDGANDKQNSSDSTETEKPQWAIDLMKSVGELTGHVRTLQSGKDKGINNLEKKVDNQADVFAKALEYGKKYDDPAEAERNWWIDQQILAAKQSSELTPGSANAQQQDPGQAPGASDAGLVDPDLLKQLEIDPTSAEYLTQVSAGKVGNAAALAVLAARNEKQNIEGAATGASGGSGTGGAVETAQVVLREQYNAALDKAQKEAGGVLQPLALYKIQEEFTKQGLQGIGYS